MLLLFYLPVLFAVCFETGFCFVSQAGLEINDPPPSVSRTLDWLLYATVPSRRDILKRHVGTEEGQNGVSRSDR